jgi:hypothetical protein
VAKLGGPREVDRNGLGESYESTPSARGRELHRELKLACAIAHGRGAKLSKLELIELVLEEGLPPRVERERIRDAKLADEGTTPPSSPPPSD